MRLTRALGEAEGWPRSGVPGYDASMDIRKFFVSRALVWLLVGLVGGGLALDQWWRRHTAGLVRQLTDLEAREKEQAKRADELQARLTRDEEELKALKDELKQERDLRQRYERVLSEGRK